ncbi:MAG: dihydrodipicolinate synthase family protein [Planctomycetota bacterium]
MDDSVFRGCMPALMTPRAADGSVDHDVLVATARQLVAAGMKAVVYCGSMGDWPLVGDAARRDGVAALVQAGVPTVVGTGAISTAQACQHASHAAEVGAAGLMLIPRLLSRGTSSAAQAIHFSRLLKAGGDLPAVIYNSPYYGYQTKADLYFRLRHEYPNLVGFKEFGGRDSLSYAAEHITSAPDGGLLLVGVDTQVYHGFLQCGAKGSITGIGNCLPIPVLHLSELCQQAAAGDSDARRKARELDDALKVLSTYDEGPDLVLYYRQLMVRSGQPAYARPMDDDDVLSEAQKQFADDQFDLFCVWYKNWCGRSAIES